MDKHLHALLPMDALLPNRYSTAVNGSTPQQAFSDYYLRGKNPVLVDGLRFPNNPTCKYTGKPPAAVVGASSQA
jgi:hypothetical protein